MGGRSEINMRMTAAFFQSFDQGGGQPEIGGQQEFAVRMPAQSGEVDQYIAPAGERGHFGRIFKRAAGKTHRSFPERRQVPPEGRSDESFAAGNADHHLAAGFSWSS